MVSQSVSEMEARCACLACSGGSERLVDFYDRGWVVGHYEERASFDSDQYEDGGAWQLDQMRKAAESSNAFLCSLRLASKISIPDDATTQERKITSAQRKIGVIEPDTTPMYAFASGDGSYEVFPIGQEDTAESAFGESDADHLYKVVPLGEETRIIEGDRYRLNEYETPNTFSPWETFSPQVQSLYLGETLPEMEPGSYTGDQTELLCEEYLRVVRSEFFPLMQTGGATGTNQGFDILGEADGTPIVGEVKNKSSIDSDVVNDLRNHTSRGADAYYFVRGGGSREGINVVAIEEVLETLSSDYHRRMLDRMTSYDG